MVSDTTRKQVVKKNGQSGNAAAKPLTNAAVAVLGTCQPWLPGLTLEMHVLAPRASVGIGTRRTAENAAEIMQTFA
ncbi:hypothetical protein GCM10027048_35780 [Hymenobacter coalescens]